MSYILDALKKAEAERDPDTRASLAMAQHHSSRQRLLLYGVIIALLVNAVVLVWLFFPDSGADPAATAFGPRADTAADAQPASVVSEQPASGFESAPRFTPAPPPQPQSAPQPTPPNADMTQSSPPALATRTARTATVPPAADPETSIRIPPPAAPPESSSRLTLAGLPPAARARFPELEFSTHIYADDPNLRAVVVNGTRLVEGDVLAGMRVHEITTAGAVFAFEDYLVAIAVLEDWN